MSDDRKKTTGPIKLHKGAQPSERLLRKAGYRRSKTDPEVVEPLPPGERSLAARDGIPEDY